MAATVTVACPSIDSVMAEAMTLTLAPTRGRLSLPRLIKLCAKASAISSGEQLHALSFKLGLSPDLYLHTALISLYSYCGHIQLALQVFDKMPHRNIVAWSAAINACLRANHPDSALLYFSQMLESGIDADSFSLVGALSASAHLGALNVGRSAHSYIKKTGVEIADFTGTALVDMYCKCGSINDAVIAFNSIPVGARTIQTWNAMIHGLAVHGLGANAIQVFDEMISVGMKPNAITFVGLLCGCAHGGLLEEGRFYFKEMVREYGIEPTVKHYGCMVDMLGRAGRLDEAYETIMDMRGPPSFVVWGALLSACRLHGNMRIAELAIERMGGDERPVGDTSHFVILSNMYKGVGLREKMANVRAMVGSKPKGLSWIEAGGKVHKFRTGCGDTSDNILGEIKEKLDEDMKVEERLGGEKRKEESSESEALRSSASLDFQELHEL